MTTFSIFSQMSDDVKESLISEFMRIESKSACLDIESLKHSSKLINVEYETPETKGSLPVVVTPDDIGGEMILVKTSDGAVFIAVSNDYFIEKGFTVEFYTCVAHELGHYLSGHLDRVELSVPNLYKEENLKLCEAGDQEEHVRLSVKAVLEGGYLEKELEADLVAVKFVGMANVVAMQISSAGNADNPLVALDKFNRCVALSKLDCNGAGYSISIVSQNTTQGNANE